MKWQIALVLMFYWLVSHAQQSPLDMADIALSTERQAGNIALSIKDQRIAALLQEIERLKKEAALCKSVEDKK